MNALDMKLGSTESLFDSSKRGEKSNGAKCSKVSRKKISPLNGDKDALKVRNGLRCESAAGADLENTMSVVSGDNCFLKKQRVKKTNSCENGKMQSISDKIQDRLQYSLSEESKRKISSVLNEIKLFSDVEKLFLYLQLPTGSPVEVDPLKQKNQNNPLGKKADEEWALATTWIQSHFEEDPDVSLPKQEVYDEYRIYCDVTGNKPLSSADFGKIMKQIFPSVKPRRLGIRGNSRYCYSGLRKKFKVQAPSLPDLRTEKENCQDEEVHSDTEVTTAASHLLFEWTEKLLGSRFTSLTELATHLIENMYVDNRSVAAFTVLLSTSAKPIEKGSSAAHSKCENGNKRSETQIHLHRKIQEKELIKEQKRKLQEQRSGLPTISETKSANSKKKSQKNKRSRVPSAHAASDEDKILDSLKFGHEECTATKFHGAHDDKIVDECNNEATLKERSKVISNVAAKDSINNSLPLCQETTGQNIEKNNNNQQSPSATSDTEECIKKKKSVKVAISRAKTPVCISQSLPGFIIMPPLPTVQIAELGSKPSGKAPSKYKRIQPKPVKNTTSSIIRCRAGSVGSAHQVENRCHIVEGRRSSHAWLQSDGGRNQELNSEPCSASETTTVLSNDDNPSVSVALSPVKKEFHEFNCDMESSTPPPYDPSCELNSVLVKDTGSDVVSISAESGKGLSVQTEFLNALKTNKNQQSVKHTMKENMSITEDYGAIKRPSEEADGQIVATKRPHLEELLTSEISGDSLSPWSKDVCNINCDISTALVQSSSDFSTPVDIIDTHNEDVSVNELESDALIEYLNGNEIDPLRPNLISSPSTAVSPNIIHPLQPAAEKNIRNCGSNNENQMINNKNNQLSQLRILLQKNLPHTVTNKMSPRASKELPQISKKKHIFDQSLSPYVLSKHHEILNSNGESGNFVNLRKFLLTGNKFFLKKKCEIGKSLSNDQNDELKNDVFASVDLHRMGTVLPDGNDLPSADIAVSQQDLLSVIPESYVDGNFSKNNSQLININENTELSVIVNSYDEKIPSSPMQVISAEMELPTNQICDSMNVIHNTVQTQIPSVPASPDTRRRAFNFLPISPRHTPIAEVLNNSGTSGYYSPVPGHGTRNAASIGVGPSQPPSAAGSPFVSPRSTPIPLSRSRHSSGQSSYSTSRHTPFQNFDSGVSSISTSPFISPQPTPVPVSRLRHNSSHGPSKTVTFSTVNNPQVIHTQSSLVGHCPLRTRHSSSPGGPHLTGLLMSPRSAPLSPLVGDNCSQTSFTFGAANEGQILNTSNSGVSSLFSVTEQFPLSNNVNNTNGENEMCDVSVTLLSDPETFLNEGARDEMLGLNSLGYRNTRQRHASSSVTLNKSSSSFSDSLSQEIQLFLKNRPSNVASNPTFDSRSRSVPLNQMLRNLCNNSNLLQSNEDTSFSKSHPNTPVTNQTFTFPVLQSNPVAASLNMITLAGDSLKQNRDKDLIQPLQGDWADLDGTNDMESSSVRRNISSLLETPLGDDLQTTLDDLRDCDNDFSKFAQELEDMSQNEETGL